MVKVDKEYFESAVRELKEGLEEARRIITISLDEFIHNGGTERMASLASLCNIIVHRYWSIDDARICMEAMSGGVDVVEKFIGEVEGYVSKDP